MEEKLEDERLEGYVVELIKRMDAAADQDREANKQKKPALNKMMMLEEVCR